MADTKISELTAGTPAQSTDMIPAQRGAGNVKLPASDFATAAQGVKADSASQPGDTHAATSKTTPVDDDEVPLQDSAASYGLKRLTWANIKATLKTYLDTLYPAKGAATTSGLTMATARLLGRTTASTGAVEEISVGSGLTLTGGILDAVSGAGIADASSLTLDTTHANTNRIPAGTQTYTVDGSTGWSVSDGVSVWLPASGTVSFAVSGGPTLNGGTSTLARTLAGNSGGYVVLNRIAGSAAYSLSGA